LARDDGEGEYCEANGHRSSADAKQLVKIERNDSSAITKILSESCTEFMSLWRRSFCLRQMYNDPEWFIGRELSRPSDDEFLYIVVEILFAERKRIQAMKELGDFSIRISIAFAAVVGDVPLFIFAACLIWYMILRKIGCAPPPSRSITCALVTC
jgi:hypothetical protein